ncbi:MAG TPA: thioredoxin domain-containing protein [Candidatus Polarisedimenticolaceae bacterium]|nr:thioredoxin domain-containing protein [Candidatus Polarisedimenticolaceae bacterium]
MSHPPAKTANHLAGQTSPYLLQHQYNPVDWYPWGEEALAKAKRENKPIFLSIGYAACHWCHVMEHESFENAEIAALLNASFVAIKVDREERPDLDDVYMTAVQMMTGQGGWPLNVFLTPDGRPFFGGTYFPPDDRGGMRGFPAVLGLIKDAWTTRHDEVVASAGGIAKQLASALTPAPVAADAARAGTADQARAAADLASRFDAKWGGFGGAPKFPPHASLALLLREHALRHDAFPLKMVETTLDRMARGGMYDQIGGGFARYSTDGRWLVPHFEKMLYDQALLVPVYVDAWLVTRNPLYRRVVLETLDFVRREMTAPEGGFYASLDADSEGHEGKFYVWTPAEIVAVLGPTDGPFFCATYGITPAGNFEGKNIPNLLDKPLDETLEGRVAPMKAKLLEARSRRVRPATDDKVLTSWNALMITAYARAYQAFGRAEDLRSAERATEFLKTRLTKNGRLLVSWRAGEAHLNAYLDDYAFAARAAIDLYESSFDPAELTRARALAATILARFGDGHGGFHFTSDDHEALLARSPSAYDGAIPAGSGVAAEVFARLAEHLGGEEMSKARDGVLRALAASCKRAPSAFATLLVAATYADGPVIEVAIVGAKDDPRTAALIAASRNAYFPARAVAWTAAPVEQGLPLLEHKTLLAGAPAAYVCKNRVCAAPVGTPDALKW